MEEPFVRLHTPNLCIREQFRNSLSGNCIALLVNALAIIQPGWVVVIDVGSIQMAALMILVALLLRKIRLLQLSDNLVRIQDADVPAPVRYDGNHIRLAVRNDALNAGDVFAGFNLFGIEFAVTEHFHDVNARLVGNNLNDVILLVCHMFICFMKSILRRR